MCHYQNKNHVQRKQTFGPQAAEYMMQVWITKGKLPFSPTVLFHTISYHKISWRYKKRAGPYNLREQFGPSALVKPAVLWHGGEDSYITNVRKTQWKRAEKWRIYAKLSLSMFVDVAFSNHDHGMEWKQSIYKIRSNVLRLEYYSHKEMEEFHFMSRYQNTSLMRSWYFGMYSNCSDM